MAKTSKSLSGRRTKIFADLTACLEDAHEHAVAGQNSRLPDADVAATIDAINSLLERAQRLLQLSRDISRLKAALRPFLAVRQRFPFA
jgi:hypothetical protein